jgi:hypothetical protein
LLLGEWLAVRLAGDLDQHGKKAFDPAVAIPKQADRVAEIAFAFRSTDDRHLYPPSIIVAGRPVLDLIFTKSRVLARGGLR